MYDIQLRKGGKLFVKIWSAKDNDYQEKEVDYNDLSFHLHDTICFESGVVLKDLFILFKKDIKLFSLATGCIFLESFIEEIGLPNKPSKIIESGLSGFSVNWVAYSNKFLDIYPIVKGLGFQDFDIGMIKMNEISRLPIILNHQCYIIDEENNNILLKTYKPFTLLNISKAILDELGSNPPKVRDFINEFGELPTPDVVDKIMECFNKVAKCNICGKDVKSYHFNKPNDICGECFDKSKEN